MQCLNKKKTGSGCQGGGGGSGMDWELGVNGCKLLLFEWIRKVWYTHTKEYYSAMKKKQNNAIFSNMDGTRASHTE